MAIQQRRGAKADFDANKMLPGELAVTTDGTRKVYAAFAPGDVKELASAEDVEASVRNGIEEIERKKDEALASLPEYEKKLAELEVYKANSIKQKLSGEVITSKDCAQVPPLGIKLFGKGTQKQYPGYQLFDASKFETTTIGNFTLTNNGDGSLTFNGEGALTQGINIRYRLTHEETVKMLKAGKIHLQAGVITYPYLNIALKHANGHYCGLYNNTVAYNNANVTEEMINDETCYLEIVLYGSSGGQSITPVTIKPMLYQDGDGTWEPFVGGEQSPNINYPQIPVFHGESGSVEGNLSTNNLINLTEQDINSALSISIPVMVVEGSYILGVYDEFGVADGFKSGSAYAANFIDEQGSIVVSNINLGVDITKEQAKLIKAVRFYYAAGYYTGNGSKYNVQLERGKVKTTYGVCNNQPFTVLTPNGLKGIPLGTTIPDAIKNSPIHMSGVYWDSAEQQYYNADTENEDSKDIQRIVEFVLTGQENCLAWGDKAIAVVLSSEFVMNKGYCTHYLNKSLDNVFDGIERGFYIHYQYGQVCFYDENYDATTFKTMLAEKYAEGDPIKVYAILAEPIITDLTQEEIDQYNSLVMNYPITNVVNDAGAYMEVEYVADTQLHIEQNYVSIDKYNEHENRIAEIEKAMVNS